MCHKFLFLQAVGTWYVLNHTSNLVEDALDCISVTYGSIEGNTS